MEYRAKIACFRTQTSQIRTKIKNYLKKTKASAKKTIWIMRATLVRII